MCDHALPWQLNMMNELDYNQVFKSNNGVKSTTNGNTGVACFVIVLCWNNKTYAWAIIPYLHKSTTTTFKQYKARDKPISSTFLGGW